MNEYNKSKGHYFKQNYIRSCSAQSVAVFINYVLQQKCYINDCELLKLYPKWKEKIDEINEDNIRPGIRLKGLKIYVDDIFNCNSEIVNNVEKREFKKDLKQNYIIINFHNKYKGSTEGHFFSSFRL